ncbi:MAG: outer membrane lipoprotein-sorting protein [Spirochaetes bacterium]|jgi:outer membrane lipoprotein-sorting protein|nr:outer membrane lipoprotein-sorting protein [Spirochaetota bacterium]
MRYIKIILLLLFFVPLIITSQESRLVEVTAQEILARVDDVLQYPSGQMKGNLMHIYPDGRSVVRDILTYVAKDNYLFTFSSKQRGNEIRILYNLGGEDTWVYNILSLKLFHKVDVDRYDPIFESNFSFIDISNADLQSNYTGKILRKTTYKSNDVIILNLDPIFKDGKYGKLTLYVAASNYLPIRIDYHDNDNAITKTLSFTKMSSFNKRNFPVRYDMLHIGSGTLSIIEFSDYDHKVTFPNTTFRHENMASVK